MDSVLIAGCVHVMRVGLETLVILNSKESLVCACSNHTVCMWQALAYILAARISLQINKTSLRIQI